MRRHAARWVSVRSLSLGAALAAIAVLVVTLAACSTPPVGWQGAGRMQALPAPQPDSGGPMGDAGAGTGGPGPDPGGVMGINSHDAGADADTDADAS